MQKEIRYSKLIYYKLQNTESKIQIKFSGIRLNIKHSRIDKKQ